MKPAAAGLRALRPAAMAETGWDRLSLLDDPRPCESVNVYKDQRYIETAILGPRLGRQPVVVIGRPRGRSRSLPPAGPSAQRP